MEDYVVNQLVRHISQIFEITFYNLNKKEENTDNINLGTLHFEEDGDS